MGLPVPFTLLVPPGRQEEAEYAFRPLPVQVIEMLPKELPRRQLDLGEFDESVYRREDQDLYHAYQREARLDPGRIAEIVVGPPGQWSPAIHRLLGESWIAQAVDDDFSAAALQISRMATLDAALREASTTSVLTAMTLTLTDGRVHVMPYHGEGLHSATTPTEAAVLVRPARINRTYWANFGRAIEQLETLVNQPKVREADIERLLRANPLFLNSLGYRDVYHQVVLPRTVGADLRPDVIAEPADSQWAEILDLKLPTAKVLVGRSDRAAMSAALTEAVAQLREYAAFFDDRRTAARVEQTRNPVLPAKAHGDHRSRPVAVFRRGAAASADRSSRSARSHVRRPSPRRQDTFAAVGPHDDSQAQRDRHDRMTRRSGITVRPTVRNTAGCRLTGAYVAGRPPFAAPPHLRSHTGKVEGEVRTSAFVTMPRKAALSLRRRSSRAGPPSPDDCSATTWSRGRDHGCQAVGSLEVGELVRGHNIDGRAVRSARDPLRRYSSRLATWLFIAGAGGSATPTGSR